MEPTLLARCPPSSLAAGRVSRLPEELVPVSPTVLNQKLTPSAPSFDRELIFIRDANL